MPPYQTLGNFGSTASSEATVAQPPSGKASSLQQRRSSTFADLLELSGLAPHKGCSNGDGRNSSSVNIGSGAQAAVDDMALQLKFWGKSSLDEEAFNFLLDDIGYTRPRDGLFDSFLQDIVSADSNFDVTSRTVSIENLRQMYSSEAYSIPEQAVFNNGEALMSFVETLFRKADVTGDNVLDFDEVKQFLRCLLGSEPSLELVKDSFAALDVDGDGSVNFEEFKSFMLKANTNDTSELSGVFNEAILSPSHTTDDEFVTELETYTKEHRAVNHHLLKNLACAAFGQKETADLLLRFLSAYSKFNSNFISNINTLLELLDNYHHIEVLSENLEEEMGQYDEETLVECEKMGIKRESVEGIPHRQLFVEFVELLETKLARSYSKFMPDYICAQLQLAIEESTKHGKLGLLAILYFGSELIVPEIYSSILDGLRLSMGLTNEEAKFLILHIDMDKDHADALREIIVANCRTKTERSVLVKCTQMLLDARVDFYDSLLKHASFGTAGFSDKDKSSLCLADTTCHPIVLDMCRDRISGSTVLDLGSGDGRLSRRLLSEGATKTVGVDMNSAMIETANAHPAKSRSEYYVAGDVTKLKHLLLSTTNQTNLMPGRQFDVGLFDLTVASNLFNFLNITEMEKCFRDVFSLSKPGAEFVISVSHPFKGDRDAGSRNYFANRDRLVEQEVVINGGQTTILCSKKTLQDYIDAALSTSFEIMQIEETRDFHLILRLRKPDRQQPRQLKRRSSLDHASMLPKNLTWSKAAMSHPQNAFYVDVPSDVKEELYKAALSAYQDQIGVDDLCAGYFPADSFVTLRRFAVTLRNSLLHETGVVLLKGLDIDTFSAHSNSVDQEQVVACSKLAYYLLCNHIGDVDGSARGKLFDVKNTFIDAMGRKDNVLFSVSDCEADWHTDGASKDKVYDCVGLLCINQASVGGKSKLSNACNAYDKMQSFLPKLMLHELTRPVPRDILENGRGRGNENVGTELSRTESILQLRISYNSYPIYDVSEEGRIRFRYMRHWIETAHQKVNWKLPTMLRIAMDVLDDTLSEGCCFHERLERGDILICNNGIVSHGRDAFEDVPGVAPRHLVRAWMQCQKVDLYQSSQG